MQSTTEETNMMSSSNDNDDALHRRNEELLNHVLNQAEQALEKAQARWNDSTRRGSSRRRNHDAKLNEKAMLLKQHAPKVSEALLLYEHRVDKSTKRVLQTTVLPLDKTLVKRALGFLQQWQMSLEPGDLVHCPDYMDEYEKCNTNSLFVKHYCAKIVEIAQEGSSVGLGDTSLDEKPHYTIGPGEKAICVTYTEYHTTRWILITPPEETIARHVVPRNSHKAIVQALQMAKADDTEQEEEAADKEQEEDVPVTTSLSRKRALPTEKNSQKNEAPDDLPDTKRFRVVDPSKEQVNGQDLVTHQTEPEAVIPVAVSQPSQHVEPMDLSEKVVIDEPVAVTMDDAAAHASSSGRESVVSTPSIASESQKQPKKKETRRRADEQQPKKSRKKANNKPPEENKEDFVWICTECKEAECQEDVNSPLIICEGECQRPFHYPCAGLASVPPSDTPWICNDCIQGQHQCTVCQEYGVDNHDVFCCSKPDCGRFYHESCLTMYNVQVDLVEIPNKDEDAPSDDDLSHVATRPRFICPAHQCWTCTEEYIPPDEEENDAVDQQPPQKRGGKRRKKKKSSNSMSAALATKKGRVYPCLECPIAYHVTCIPPVARFHELALLCHEHASTSRLPELDVESSFQGQVEADVDKKLSKIERGNKRKEELKRKRLAAQAGPNLFFPGVRGDVSSPEEKTLHDQLSADELIKCSSDWNCCLPCGYKAEVHSKPPSYRQVHRLRYDPANRPKRRPPSGESCRCKVSCDEHCLNRMVMMECTGGSGTSGGVKNPYSNCNLGPECGNRSLGMRKFAKCRPQREQGKGWGLVAVNGAKEGELIQEYTGEVIDEETKKKRLEAWARDHPNDPNFYVMYLDTGWYIDARNEANMSRFINHSCDPNCKLVRVNVGGYMHVVIKSCRNIAPGEFLSYDYQFDTRDGDKFVCRCGAAKCRGTLAGKELEDGAEKKTKKQEREDARVRFERDKKFLEDLEKDEARRRWHVSDLVPGTTKDETVASGPQDCDREFAVKSRLFLWRNVVLGADFSARCLSMQKSRKKSCSSRASEAIDVFSLLEKLS